MKSEEYTSQVQVHYPNQKEKEKAIQEGKAGKHIFGNLRSPYKHSNLICAYHVQAHLDSAQIHEYGSFLKQLLANKSTKGLSRII